MKKFLAVVGLVLFPFAAFAHENEGTPGTDAYLKNVLGWSTERLTTPLNTEERLPFDVATGEQIVDDPLGDVLSGVGTETTLAQPWGDLSGATLIKNSAKKTWDFTLTLGGDVPAKPTIKANFLVYADADGKPENDSPDPGVKLGMDSEFNVEYGAKNGWYVDYRWYNSAPNARVWAINKKTNGTFAIHGNTITLSVPFAEMPGDAVPHWRIAAALQSGSDTEVDVAPTDGFPDAKGTTDTGTKPSPSTTTSPAAMIQGFASKPANDIILGAIVVVAGYLIWNARKK